MGFRISHPRRNVMGQSTERSPLVSMLFQTFLRLLKFLFYILVCLFVDVFNSLDSMVFHLKYIIC